MKTQPARFNTLSIFFHWASALLMLMTLLSAELRHLFVNAGFAPMRSIMVLHIGAGMAGLFLVIPRILARLIDTKPTQIDHGNPLNHFLAKTVHVMLYLLLIIVPLVGWIIVNAKGMLIPMPLLGFEFPALVPASTELVNTTVLIHEILARAFYVIIGLHVIAALWHHFVKKDGVLCHITWITPPSQQPVIATSYKHIPKSKIKQYSQA